MPRQSNPNTNEARERRLKYHRDYQRIYRISTVGDYVTPSDAGEAAELLVASDLLTRGLKVNKPINRNGQDDLHAKFVSGWRSLQVKTGQRNTRTGALTHTSRRFITSDIFAVVDLKAKLIRYLPLLGQELPQELIDEV